MNTVCLVGNAGNDPSVRTFEGGKKKASVSMAIRRPVKEDKTDWIEIQLWDKSAEIAEKYLRKGNKFGITGRIQQEKWEQDGEKRSKIIIVATHLDLLQPKADDEQAEQSEPEQQEQSAESTAGSIFGGYGG